MAVAGKFPPAIRRFYSIQKISSAGKIVQAAGEFWNRPLAVSGGPESKCPALLRTYGDVCGQSMYRCKDQCRGGRYRGSCGGPSWPVLMNSMGFPVRWLNSIRTDTGFFPPGSERDRGWRGLSTIPIPSMFPDTNIPPVAPPTGPWHRIERTRIYYRTFFFFRHH